MISPQEALFRLKDGNRRYVTTLRSPIVHLTLTDRLELVGAQAPFAIILGCSDSRVPVEVVFDQGVGDLFVIRVAGNVAMSPQIGSIEYAALTFGTKLVVILGHTHCGAVQATYEERQKPGGLHSDHLKGIINEVRPAFDAFPDQIFRKNESELIHMAVRANVRNMVERVQTESSIIADLVASSTFRVVGAEYDIETGAVEFFDGLEEGKRRPQKIK
jgi:carbonic anhydrase